MRGLWAAVLALGSAAHADDLSVAIGDGNPWDTIQIINHADCPLVAAALQVDFSSSKGRLVIDTEYGGAGTKDPMPVQVLEGLALVDPVADGARRLTVRIGALPPKARVIVGLDMDNETGFWRQQRIEFDDIGLAGTGLTLALGGQQVTRVFDQSGQVTMPLPAQNCDAPPDEGGTTVPIS